MCTYAWCNTHTRRLRGRSPHLCMETGQEACLLQLRPALPHAQLQGLPGLHQSLLPPLHCLGLRPRPPLLLPACSLQQFPQLGTGQGTGGQGSRPPRG